MAGYICKIVIETTHPPVWRRVIVPERITFDKTDIAEKLIGQLKHSSPVGKKEAGELENRLQQRYEVVDSDDWFDDFDWIPPTYEKVQQPYVRTSAKIGRNDPCPCGSGKKYKKCCGRN